MLENRVAVRITFIPISHIIFTYPIYLFVYDWVMQTLIDNNYYILKAAERLDVATECQLNIICKMSLFFQSYLSLIFVSFESHRGHLMQKKKNNWLSFSSI